MVILWQLVLCGYQDDQRTLLSRRRVSTRWNYVYVVRIGRLQNNVRNLRIAIYKSVINTSSNRLLVSVYGLQFNIKFIQWGQWIFAT